MATYSKLASLAGLQPGDIINYTYNSSDTAELKSINLSNQNVKITLKGAGHRGFVDSYDSLGGVAIFNIDASKLPTQNLIYMHGYDNSPSLLFNPENITITTDNFKKYVIAVAGNGGHSCEGTIDTKRW